MANLTLFPGNDRQSLETDITFLTTALTGFRYQEPIPAPKNTALSRLQRLSTILTIGEVKDPNAANVNAVTAYVVNEEIVTAICTRNAEFDMTETEKEITSQGNGEQLLDNCITNKYVLISYSNCFL